MKPVRSADFPVDGRSVAAARAFVANVSTGHPRGDDAVLLVSEVATNAIVYGSANGSRQFRVIVRRSPARIYTAVVDGGGGGVPTVRRHGAEAEHGRGLEIVDRVASVWGVVPVAGGHRVWFELLSRAAWRYAGPPVGGPVPVPGQ